MFTDVNSGRRNAMAHSFVADWSVPESIIMGIGLSICNLGESFFKGEGKFLLVRKKALRNLMEILGGKGGGSL
jgi:hypothetical protein